MIMGPVAILALLWSGSTVGLISADLSVVTPGGDPPPGPSYVVLRDQERGEVAFEAVVESGGRVHASVPPGSYELSCAARGFSPRGFAEKPLVIETNAGKPNAFTCPLSAAVEVTGTVVAELTGKPLANARVYYAAAAGDPRLTSRARAFFVEVLGGKSDGNGRFSLFLPPKSRVTLAAEGEATARVRWPVTVPVEGGDLGRFVLPPGGDLLVSLPQEAAELGKLRLGLRPLWSLWAPSPTAGSQAVVDVGLHAGSSVLWDKIPAGWYVAQAGLGPFARDYLWRSALEVAPGATLELPIPLVPWSLQGRVSGVGEELWPCRVVASGYGGLWVSAEVHREQGSFSLRVPRREPVRLSLECQEGRLRHVFDQGLVLPASAQPELELRLPQGKVAVTLKDRHGRPAKNVRVIVAHRTLWTSGPGGTICEGTPDEQGRFQCFGIEVGRAMVLAQGGGFYGPGEVNDGAELELRSGREVRVVVTHEGKEAQPGEARGVEGEPSFSQAAFACFDAPALLVASTQIEASGVAVFSDVPRCAGFVTVTSNDPQLALGFASVPEGGDATVSVNLGPAGVAVVPAGVSRRLTTTCNPGRYVWNWGRARRFPVPEGFSFFTNFPPLPDQPLVVARAPVGQPLTLEAVDWEGRVCGQWSVPAPLPPLQSYTPLPPLPLPRTEGGAP